MRAALPSTRIENAIKNSLELFLHCAIPPINAQRERPVVIDPPRDELVLGILHYVTEHPTAKDTIEGIEMWWLPKRIARESKETLQQRLNSLVKKGWLIERRSPQSQTIYSLNDDATAEINEFLTKRD